MSLENATSRLYCSRIASRVAPAGEVAVRYALVFVIAWIGALKFTTYEANAIQPLVASSPLMSWVYDIFSVTTFSAVLGVVELATAALIAVKPWAPRASIVGSVMAIGMFAVTLSFMFTTPGVMALEAGGFPVLSMVGNFLVKDVVLLAVALWTLGDAVRTLRAEPLGQ
ncbi:YkgB family protein [Mycolicibacterium mageritense]|uniref:YkgB family protein n=1 Tax=Mycolicibacterium mageritense TaxID=53462 RepID=UPI003AFF8058